MPEKAAAVHEGTEAIILGSTAVASHYYRDQGRDHKPAAYHPHNGTAGFPFPPYSTFGPAGDCVAPPIAFGHIGNGMVGSTPAFTPAMNGTGTEVVLQDRWLFPEEHGQKSIYSASAHENRSHGIFGAGDKRRWHDLDNQTGVGVSDGH